MNEKLKPDSINYIVYGCDGIDLAEVGRVVKPYCYSVMAILDFIDNKLNLFCSVKSGEKFDRFINIVDNYGLFKERV